MSFARWEKADASQSSLTVSDLVAMARRNVSRIQLCYLSSQRKQVSILLSRTTILSCRVQLGVDFGTENDTVGSIGIAPTGKSTYPGTTFIGRLSSIHAIRWDFPTDAARSGEPGEALSGLLHPLLRLDDVGTPVGGVRVLTPMGGGSDVEGVSKATTRAYMSGPIHTTSLAR